MITEFFITSSNAYYNMEDIPLYTSFPKYYSGKHYPKVRDCIQKYGIVNIVYSGQYNEHKLYFDTQENMTKFLMQNV